LWFKLGYRCAMTTLEQTPTGSNSSQRQLLAQWYSKSRVAARLREQYADDLRRILDDWFGYHLLIIGVDTGIDINRMTRVQHLLRIIPDGSVREEGEAGTPVMALDEDLPIETESVDVVVLMHALDFSESPHQLLREVHRVLTPHGHLVILGNNRYSPRGWWYQLRNTLKGDRRASQQAPGLRKLDDWLRLLDFATAPVRHKLIVPTGGRGRVGAALARLDQWLVEHNLFRGSAFLLYANKTVRGHISGKRVASTNARLIGLPVAKPVVGARGAASEPAAQRQSHLRPVD